MTKKGHKKKKRLKLKVKVLVKILVFLCVAFMCFNYYTNLKIKNIYITGNEIIKDVTIIEAAGIKDYPLVKNINKKAIENKINQLQLINKAKVKISPLGKITIIVEETNILFFYKYNNKYITSSNESIDDNKAYYGVPTLVNFTPDTIFDKLIEGFNKIDYNIIKMINEIEYSPYKTEDGTTIDDELFTLKMNDGNTVMIDIANIKNLNKYNTIYVSLELDKIKGIIYLDTIIDERLLFKSYDTIANEEVPKEETEEKEEE
jgi:cell division septal protein FtsQ